MNFINYYQNRGHVLGECMSRTDSDLMYVYIPKNASSWTKPNLLSCGWDFYNYRTDHLNKTALVVLRDPIDRWLSGMAEYLYLYHRQINLDEINSAFFDLVFDKVAFDDHTECQVYFIQGIDYKNCIFFKFGLDYRNQFSQFLNDRNIPNQFNKTEYVHVSDHDPERLAFKKIISQQMRRSKYLEQIQNYFQQDYDLINSVEFYGTR